MGVRTQAWGTCIQGYKPSSRLARKAYSSLIDLSLPSSLQLGGPPGRGSTQWTGILYWWTWSHPMDDTRGPTPSSRAPPRSSVSSSPARSPACTSSRSVSDPGLISAPRRDHDALPFALCDQRHLWDVVRSCTLVEGATLVPVCSELEDRWEGWSSARRQRRWSPRPPQNPRCSFFAALFASAKGSSNPEKAASRSFSMVASAAVNAVTKALGRGSGGAHRWAVGGDGADASSPFGA